MLEIFWIRRLDAKEVRGEMVQAVTGIIYLTGRETKQTKHCRGVAPQTQRPRANGRSETKNLKLGTKVLTFVPWKVFRIMAIARSERRGGKEDAIERSRLSGDLYISPRFRNY